MAEPVHYKNYIASPENPYILALDVGTTTIRSHLYDKYANTKGFSCENVELLHPRPGWVEMDPDVLWKSVQNVIKQSIQEAGLSAKEVTCMGITTQRNTFITWDKQTGKPFHPFITWQDLRAADLVKEWNESYTMKGFSNGTKALHLVTRKTRFLAASVLRFKSQQIIMRLLWVLKNNVELQKRVKEEKVMFGTIDTWLLWKLTRGKQFFTEYSCCSSSGLYDPFTMEWSAIVSSLLGIPLHIFPPIKDTSGEFGCCHKDLFGAEIPIMAMVADQQGATFGQCCFEKGDIKCSMGTGTFMDLNTGQKPHGSVAGLYPLIGWKIGSEVVFLAEGNAADTGLCLEWAKQMGFFTDVTTTSNLAQTVPDTGGVHFIPAFNGLQAPINDDKACCSLIGITMNTTHAHIIRAILEALAFRCKLIYETMLKESSIKISSECQNGMTVADIRIDGGVSNNDFLMQLVADLLRVRIFRPKHTDSASLGAAFLAGLAAGVWKNKEELKRLQAPAHIFEPREETLSTYKPIIAEWERALKRAMHWYQERNE